jgi:hypothetical protein
VRARVPGTDGHQTRICCNLCDGEFVSLTVLRATPNRATTEQSHTGVHNIIMKTVIAARYAASFLPSFFLTPLALSAD